MRPKFSDLSEVEQLNYGNGLGPWWFPDWVRNFITEKLSRFFVTASWRHHDFGYNVGGDRWDRARCDWKFFVAMIRDATNQRGSKIVLTPLAITIALFCYIAVRIGGVMSFKYEDQHHAK